MQIQMLAVTTADQPPGQYTSSYLAAPGGASIDTADMLVAVDAGCLGFWNTPEDQMRVKHVPLTHAHADHIASLPIFLENVFDPGPDAPTIYATRETLDALRAHLLNNVLWPDFIGMSNASNAFCHAVEIEAETPFTVGGLEVLPVAVDHQIPTVGFLIREPGTAATAIFAADSGPTDRIWQAATEDGRDPRLALIEASFPDAMHELAVISKHLTPATLATEAAKLPGDTRVVAVHVKPRFKHVIAEELVALGLPNLELGQTGQRFEL